MGSCHPNDEGVVMALLVSTLAALFCTVMVTDAGVHGDQRSDRVAHLRQHSMVSSKPRRQIVDDEQSSLMLSCHVCHSFTNESSCVHLADNSPYFSEPCVGLHMSCMVKRFSYTENATSPSSIWSVERNCTSKCQPGCLMLGERTKLYVCTSCCSEPLCNDGNAGLSSLQRVSNLANIFLTVVVPVLPWMSSRLMFF